MNVFSGFHGEEAMLLMRPKARLFKYSCSGGEGGVRGVGGEVVFLIYQLLRGGGY